MKAVVWDSRDVAQFSISHHCAEMKDSERGLLLMSSVTLGGPIVSVGWMWDRTCVWAASLLYSRPSSVLGT